MKQKSILVVDDEKNIRLTVSQSLESLEIPVHTAVNGEDALVMLKREPFSMVFRDLKMPGMDGMDILRKINKYWPKTRVIIITAHGTIESAVEAMKLGAVDFIQKPFTPDEIRDLAKKVLQRETLDAQNVTDYVTLIELAKLHISDHCYQDANDVIRKAISADPARAEAYNLLGVLFEIMDDQTEALKFYRAALDIDPTYKPAWANLERATSWHKLGKIDLGPGEKANEAKNNEIGERPDEK